MATKVLLKKSSVSSKIPTTSDLDYGELAINYADGRLYFKNSSNTIDYFSSGSGSGSSSDSFKTISVSGQSDVIADSSIDTLTLVAGSNITLTTDAANDSITIASSGSSDIVYFDVIGRSSTITTILTSVLQVYLNWDEYTFRDPVGIVLDRSSSSISVLG